MAQKQNNTYGIYLMMCATHYFVDNNELELELVS